MGSLLGRASLKHGRQRTKKGANQSCLGCPTHSTSTEYREGIERIFGAYSDLSWPGDRQVSNSIY